MFRTVAILIVANLVLIDGAYGQLDNITSVDEALDVANALNIPGFNASALPVEQTKKALEEKCKANGGDSAYTNAVAAFQNFHECTSDLIDREQLEREMEPAKKTGDLDRVFKKYCDKSPILEGCVTNLTDAVKPCLEPNEHETLRMARNITDSLLQFICYKDGDRIALFISAGGPECLKSKEQAMQDCVNRTVSSYIPTGDMSLSIASILPALVLDTAKCEQLQNLQECISKELRTCDDATPENFVSALFDYIKGVTPCKALLKARSSSIQSSSSTLVFNAIAIALSLLAIRLSQ